MCLCVIEQLSIGNVIIDHVLMFSNVICNVYNQEEWNIFSKYAVASTSNSAGYTSETRSQPHSGRVKLPSVSKQLTIKILLHLKRCARAFQFLNLPVAFLVVNFVFQGSTHSFPKTVDGVTVLAYQQGYDEFSGCLRFVEIEAQVT